MSRLVDRVMRYCLDRVFVEAVKKATVVVADNVADYYFKEGQISKVGYRKALHICRGHFKEYKQRGLFGKVYGTFWCPQHLRGSAEEGVVSSSYLVKANAPHDPKG